MVAAMTAVKGGSHIKRAAEGHGVPVSIYVTGSEKTTLITHVVLL